MYERILHLIYYQPSGISSPITIKKVTRQPFDIDELSDKQYPAVIVQTSEETREDQEWVMELKQDKARLILLLADL